MSAFRSITMRSSFRAASPAVRQAGAFRSFQSGRVLQVVNENKEGNAERAQEIESAKQEELKKQKQGKNEYNDKLASESESAIRGEKHDKSIDQMQKEGAQAAQNEKK